MIVFAPRFGGNVERKSVGYCSVCDKDFKVEDSVVNCPKCGMAMNDWSNEYYSIETGERLV